LGLFLFIASYDTPVSSFTVVIQPCSQQIGEDDPGFFMHLISNKVEKYKLIMAKDPAFLFYPNDYMGGTLGMTLEEKGAYMELLILQFNKGHFTIEQAKKLLNGSFERLWEVVKEKFVEDETHGFFNERLEEEKNKRKKFNIKQKERGSKGGRPKKNPDETRTKPGGYKNDNPDESLLENENRNENEINSFEKSEKLLIPDMQKIWVKKFPKYFLEKEKDFPALFKISSNVAQLVGVTDNPLSQTVEEKNQIKHRWGEIVDFISREDFFKNYSLSQVDRHFQSILQKEKNGNSKTSSANHGKSSGAYELAAKLREELGIN